MWVFLVVRPVQKSNNLKNKKYKKIYTKKEKNTTRPARIAFFVLCRVPKQNFFRPQNSLSLTQIRTLNSLDNL